MPSTLLPFLYQTRTILRASPRMSAAFTRPIHATTGGRYWANRRENRREDNEIPFDSDVPNAPQPPQPPEEPVEPEDARTARRVLRGTITPTERRAFERIFADIQARGLQPAAQEDAPPPTRTGARSARLIMEQAAYDAGQSRRNTVAAPALLAGAARDRNKALLRFPPELRAAASRALDTINPHAGSTHHPSPFSMDGPAKVEEKTDEEKEAELADEGWRASADSFARTIELENKRYPERVRVEGLITDAKTDLELWDVLEREVFTMPARLGIAGPHAAPAVETSKQDTSQQETSEQATSEQENSEQETSEQEDAASAEPVDPDSPENSQELSLYVHGPLYPAYLLLALRRLDTGFRAPSSLTFALLPRIKELGLESYVLGVSTPFYNQLIQIYWTRRGDLTGMLNLLEEMRHCGLYFDEQTASILNKVDHTVFALAGDENMSPFGKAIMQMPEYELVQRSRIRHWHRAVDLSIEQRKADFAG
ncbi:hypothetical protein F4780DRAFT_477257 [Xylariomycetidae sp. FL0641]|nr:hypothetical protein F4780DRAFT_477257 [Xylariomycetidae sp. FL0641]